MRKSDMKLGDILGIWGVEGEERKLNFCLTLLLT